MLCIIVQAERKSWSYEKYCRHECLGIPETVNNSSMEETALDIFELVLLLRTMKSAIA